MQKKFSAFIDYTKTFDMNKQAIIYKRKELSTLNFELRTIRSYFKNKKNIEFVSIRINAGARHGTAPSPTSSRPIGVRILSSAQVGIPPRHAC